MSKIIGVENAERINAELVALIEEVKKRTKTTITGVKIPQLPATNTVVDTDEIIVEQQDGTKKIQVSELGLNEVMEARTDNEQVPVTHKTLKERLDNMNTKVNDNKQYITDVSNLYNVLNKEVVDARDSDAIKYTNLKERLDSISMATTTANRPSVNTYVGMCVFDTDLNKPIWRNKDNNGWVDATGANA